MPGDHASGDLVEAHDEARRRLAPRWEGGGEGLAAALRELDRALPALRARAHRDQAARDRQPRVPGHRAGRLARAHAGADAGGCGLGGWLGGVSGHDGECIYTYQWRCQALSGQAGKGSLTERARDRPPYHEVMRSAARGPRPSLLLRPKLRQVALRSGQERPVGRKSSGFDGGSRPLLWEEE